MQEKIRTHAFSKIVPHRGNRDDRPERQEVITDNPSHMRYQLAIFFFHRTFDAIFYSKFYSKYFWRQYTDSDRYQDLAFEAQVARVTRGTHALYILKASHIITSIYARI